MTAEYNGKNYRIIESLAEDFGEDDLDALMTRLLAGEVFSTFNPFRPSGLMKLAPGKPSENGDSGRNQEKKEDWVDLWQVRDRFAEFLPLRAERHWPYILIIDRDRDIGVEIYWDREGTAPPQILGNYQGKGLQRRMNSEECWVEENRYLAGRLYGKRTDSRDIPENLWLEISLVLIDVYRRSQSRGR